MGKIYNIKDYYKLLELQDKYENDIINEDDMSIKEIDGLIKLYKYQIRKIGKNIKKKLLIKNSGDNSD